MIWIEPLWVREGVGVRDTVWPFGARMRMAAEGRAGVINDARASGRSELARIGEVARQMVKTGSER